VRTLPQQSTIFSLVAKSEPVPATVTVFDALSCLMPKFCALKC
jgi:hypothetical protein